MAFHTRRQFYELCGVNRDYLKTYIRRGKVIVGDNNLIDDTVPQNREFMESRVNKPSIDDVIKPDSKPSPTKKTTTKKKAAASVSAPIGPPTTPHNPKNDEARQKYQLDLQIKELELEKKEGEVELNRIKISKQRGEVIPTELVQMVLRQQFKSITTSFHQGCDNFIATIAKRAGMKRSEMAHIRGELIDIVNKSIDDALADAKSGIRSIVREYSETRGRGEKK